MKIVFKQVKNGATVIYQNQSWMVSHGSLIGLAMQPEVEIMHQPFKMDGLWRTWDRQPKIVPQPNDVVEVVEMTYRPVSKEEGQYWIK